MVIAIRQPQPHQHTAAGRAKRRATLRWIEAAASAVDYACCIAPRKSAPTGAMRKQGVPAVLH
jgi:hypothetical protein